MLENTVIHTIHQKAADLRDTLVTLRRELHQHPELSGQESWTANHLAEKCGRLGWRVRRQVGGHGLIADFITNPAKPTVALRVDMDALPIQEIEERPYRSKIPGVMHACGHDVHSAIGVGVAAILSSMAAELSGNIRLIFQPEEEEISGALRMIHNGALSDPTPAAIFGLHVAPLPVGKLAWTDDLFLAGFEHLLAVLTSPDVISTPQHLDDVARRCCRVIKGFNEWHLPETWGEMEQFWEIMKEGPQKLKNFIIYSASTNEEDPSGWHGQLGIGIKAANRHLRRLAVGRIKAALNTISRATHTHYHLETMGAMPDMRNHTHLVQRGLPALKKAFGNNNLIELKAAFPFNCEDFAYYAKHIPGAMYWLGAANPEKGQFAILHTPDFDVDERCLVTGSTAMSVLLLDFLHNKTQLLQ